MGLSKSSRIIILLAIDSAFFLLELVVGSAVHSLALVADSFHMLNDVLSLCVGLWAVKVANEKTQSRSYTYGWQRAETLGALVNGVFLVALCLSIFLEAIQRFVEPQEVSNPKLILVVGSLGLLSNILGLFLFHDHGHSHGGHSHGGGDHGHSHGNNLSAAEEGHGHSHYGSVEHSVNAVADQSGNIADVLPQNRIAGWPQSKSMNMDNSDVTFVEDGPHQHKSSKSQSKSAHSRSRSHGYSGYSAIGDLPVHPASFRNEIINASRLEYDPASAEDTENEDGSQNGNTDADESTALLGASGKSSKKANGHSHSHSNEDWHAHHNHKQPKESKKGGHGHSHDDLNMKGVFLHVLGDALGNVGVIASALFIWLTDFSWRFYSDPAISLIITVIILCSAIPLCKAASRILLQATPEGIDVAEIEIDILDLPGIISCHHVHVWQLSDSKYVASLHVQVDFDFKGEGSARYMDLARAIRRCLHGHGIHSSTIQPEFCLDETHDHIGSQNSDDETHGASDNSGSGRRQVSKQASKTGSLRDEPEACLLECGDACDNNNKCCPPGAKDAGNDGAK